MIGDRLKQAREWAGLTQAQAAHMSEISRTALVKIESNARGISGEELYCLSSLYQVSSDWLLEKISPSPVNEIVEKIEGWEYLPSHIQDHVSELIASQRRLSQTPGLLEIQGGGRWQ